MGKNTRIKKISRIAFALLALTAWVTIVAVPVGAAPWRGGGPGWHGDIGHFRGHDFVTATGHRAIIRTFQSALRAGRQCQQHLRRLSHLVRLHLSCDKRSQI